MEELKKKFDVERIGLFAALNNATDRETQLRIQSLIAIHDNDAALAAKIKAELEAAEAAKKLTNAMEDSLAAWAAWMSMIGNSFKQAAPPVPWLGLDSGQPYQIDPSNPSYFGAPGDIPGITGQRGFNFSGGGSPTVVSNALHLEFLLNSRSTRLLIGDVYCVKEV